MYTGGCIYMRTRYVYAARSRKHRYYPNTGWGVMVRTTDGGGLCAWTRGWLGVVEAVDCEGGVAKTPLYSGGAVKTVQLRYIGVTRFRARTTEPEAGGGAPIAPVCPSWRAAATAARKSYAVAHDASPTFERHARRRRCRRRRVSAATAVVVDA